VAQSASTQDSSIDERCLARVQRVRVLILDEKFWRNCCFLSNFLNFEFESLPFSLIFLKVTITGGNPWPNFIPAIPFGMFASIFGFPSTLKKF